MKAELHVKARISNRGRKQDSEIKLGKTKGQHNIRQILASKGVLSTASSHHDQL